MILLQEPDVIDRGVSPKYRAVHISPTHQAEDVSHPCGDHLILYLTVDSGIILAANFACQACCLTTAVADVLCQNLTGQPFGTEFHPNDLIKLTAIKPNRRSCVELPFKLLRTIYGLAKPEEASRAGMVHPTGSD